MTTKRQLEMGNRQAGTSRHLLKTIVLMAMQDTSCALLTAPPRQSSFGLNRPLYNGEYTHTRRRKRVPRLPFYNDITDALALPTQVTQCSFPTSLCMSQNEGDDTNNDDRKKKYNKGEQKKANVSKGANEASKGKSKRPYKQRGGQKKGKRQSKRNQWQTNAAISNESNTDKSKSKARSSSLKTKGGSTINTSDENTSLKGFKEPKQQKQQKSKKTKQSVHSTAPDIEDKSDEDDKTLKKRVTQLESLVSTQMSEIQKLRREIDELTKTVKVFAKVVEVLREAGLHVNEEDTTVSIEEELDTTDAQPQQQRQTTSFIQSQAINDDMLIFGIAPKSVTDAADAAGSSILAAILAGKQRMMVDVRDAELTRDPQLFVEFIELAILPVAAGLEGLDADMRNRVKIVFPTVKDLMTYRKSMALAAPEVVSLSTLGFDPVEEQDKLIVVVAPSPDDLAGVDAMEMLLARTQPNYVEPDKRITQPIVVVNHHMVPVDMSSFGKFTTVYHLRLLAVQYMTGDATPEYVAKEKFGQGGKREPSEDAKDAVDISLLGVGEDLSEDATLADKANKEAGSSDEDDAALEAAMTHAHEVGLHQGVTRAMVIRSYPKPWHVFVDTSPDTDADFEVAATFDTEPTQEDVNYAIVECLEGSEREDELVAQQMQAALESGQLNRVSEMLGITPSGNAPLEDNKGSSEESNDDNNLSSDIWDDLYYDDWNTEDSV